MQTKIESQSIFNSNGYKNTVKESIAHIKELYMADEIPWVIGYSGGKDSTAVLQLVWNALLELKNEDKCKKDVHVISTDTLVENPIVSLWVEKSLDRMIEAKTKQKIPIVPHRLTPEVKDRFWVNLIGKGYPAPRHKFRWCTSRLKINPSNKFINGLVDKNGEAILVLGTRKAESDKRSKNMDYYENHSSNTRLKDKLVISGSLDRVWVYSPISDWTNDDVWIFLNSSKNPWDFPNEDLMSMYQGATDGGECPLVVDTSTQSCGSSRFGCYVCTLVSEDKSMAAMISNDREKEWMLPLLSLRNEIDVNDPVRHKRLDKLRRDKSNRDFRRMNGSLSVHISKHGADLIPGPYKQFFREHLLSKVLEAQKVVQEIGPDEVKDLELLPIDELEAIRDIWINEKHEAEDRLPEVYEDIMGKPYPGRKRFKHTILSSENLKVLKDHCQNVYKDEGHLYDQIRSLLSISAKHHSKLRRANLPAELSKSIQKGVFGDMNEAKRFALERKKNELNIKLQNSSVLTTEDKREVNEKIHMLTKSISQEGYSSLIEDSVIESNDEI